MDIKTIFICLFIINLFLGFFVFAIKRTQKTFPGIDFWIIASFLIASGYLFLSLRNVIADLLSIVLAQSFFLLAGLLRIYGLKQFFKLKFTLSVNVLFTATFFAYVFLMFYFTYYQYNIFIRTIISGLFLSAMAAYTGLLVLINRPDRKNTTYIFTAIIFFTFSFIFIFRIAGWILFPDIRDLFASAFINTIQFTSSMLIDITWSVMFFVIHNRKLTHELAVSESRFKNIFEKHHAVMLLIEPVSGKIIEANKAAENFYGYNRSQLSKLNMSDLITEKSAVNFQNDNFEAIDFQIFSHILANRTERIVEVHSTPIDLQGQNLLFSIIHDITERKKAEHALKESEEEFRAIFEKNSSAILILDEQATVINANQTFLNITGYTREEIIGTSWTKLITENDLPRLSGYHEKRLSSHQDVPEKYEFSFYNKKREMKYGLMTVAYLPQKHNIIASFTDITERKEHEIQLQEFANELNKLNSDKDKFISILAHDLRNPFHSLLGFSDLLILNLHNYDLQKIEYQLKMINQTTHQTYELLEQILMWARSQAGKLALEPENFRFIEITDEIIKTFENQANEKAIKISSFETENIILYTDLNIFRTVMRNLISNAIKFTNRNGRINIFAERIQQNVIINVSDNGIGMDKNIISKLWELSEHFSRTGTNNEKGTGFGLLLCKELLEKQGGQIWVESEPGKGSTFKFSIPLSENWQGGLL